MPRPELLPDLEAASDGVHDLVALHLVRQLYGNLRGQRHLAGHHVDVDDGELATPLPERRQRLCCDQPAPEEELHSSGLDHHVDLLVGVGDVGHQHHVAVEVGRPRARRPADADDAAEGGVGGVERRRPRLQGEVHDEDHHAGDDQEHAEGEADDGGAPHGRRGPVPRLEDDL